jgi:TonB family protein
MRTLTLLVCTWLALVQGPSQPDFSGEWVLDPSRATSTGAPMRVGGAGRGGERPAGTITEPRKVKDVPPQYPMDLLRAQKAGMVILEATIDRRGKVDDFRVLKSAPGFDKAAIEAVSKWEYTPTFVDGEAVPIVMTVTVTFSFDQRPPSRAGSTALGPGGRGVPFGQGLGRGGFVAPLLTIKQNKDGLEITRTSGDSSEKVKYRFDGKEVKNRLPGAGGALDSTYTYVSSWDAGKLVTRITWVGPQGPRERTETLFVEGDTLTMQSARTMFGSTEPYVQTNIFNRKR